MSTNPNQGQKPDPADRYGGYSGYRSPSSADDPYGAYSQSTHSGTQQNDPNYVYGSQQQANYGQQASSGQSQQQQYYQPPQSVSGRNRSRSSSSTAGLSGQTTTAQQSRRLALLSYLGICFTGLFFLFFKRRDPYVRYHAAQSVAVFTPLLALWLVISFLHGFLGGIFLVGWLFGLLFTLVTFVIGIPIAILWVFLMVTAFLGITVRIPFISTYADALVRRVAGRTV